MEHFLNCYCEDKLKTLQNPLKNCLKYEFMWNINSWKESAILMYAKIRNFFVESIFWWHDHLMIIWGPNIWWNDPFVLVITYFVLKLVAKIPNLCLWLCIGISSNCVTDIFNRDCISCIINCTNDLYLLLKYLWSNLFPKPCAVCKSNIKISSFTV